MNEKLFRSYATMASILRASEEPWRHYLRVASEYYDAWQAEEETMVLELNLEPNWDRKLG